MRALLRRLTSHHNLDRIDELDETDPFGTSYHHDGPYEAIGTTHSVPTPPRPSRRNNVYHPERELVPISLRHRVPTLHGESGLSLHLEPGQILQHNAIYSAQASSISSPTPHLPRQPNIDTAAMQPDHSPRQSLPIYPSHSRQDSSLRLLNDLHNRPLSLPQNYYLGDNIPYFRQYRDAAPIVRNQSETSVIPSPRYESRLHNVGPSPSPQCTPAASLRTTSRRTQAMGSTMLVEPRHKSTRSLDSSYAINTTITQPIGAQNTEPPRIRHLPKRLVMPTPLQPQHTQPKYTFPLQEEYPDHFTLDRASFEGQSVVHTQGPRLLRKRSSAFPEKTPIPYHVPMPQEDVMLAVGTILSKPTSVVEGAKEQTRRRRLSKRKSDS